MPAKSEKRTEETKFLADAMLGSLARKLRAFGFDVFYASFGDDSTLLERAKSEGRVLVTADRALSEMAESRGVPTMLVEGADDAKRLTSMKRSGSILGVHFVAGDSRCSHCGGRLTGVGRGQVESGVPMGVLSRHLWFYHCAACGRWYWKGTHWKKLRSLRRRLPIENASVGFRGEGGRGTRKAGPGGARQSRNSPS